MDSTELIGVILLVLALIEFAGAGITTLLIRYKKKNGLSYDTEYTVYKILMLLGIISIIFLVAYEIGQAGGGFTILLLLGCVFFFGKEIFK